VINAKSDFAFLKKFFVTFACIDMPTKAPIIEFKTRNIAKTPNSSGGKYLVRKGNRRNGAPLLITLDKR
jgi:hypothetical protein